MPEALCAASIVAVLALAAARALVVVRHLQAKGVALAQMEAISNGGYHPVASNDTAAGRAQNRRTDLLLRPTN